MARTRIGQFFHGARITRGCLYLLFVSVGLSLVFLASDQSIRDQLGRILVATPNSVWGEYKFWQILTSPLLETSFISLIFQGFMLWMFLPSLERWWGTKRFLLFALYTCVVGVAIGTLVGWLVGMPGVHITGLDPFVYGSIVAYGVLFSNQPVQFFGVIPMTGKQLTIGICAFVAFFIIIGQQWAEGAAWASAMILALVLTHDRISPRLWWLKYKQKRIRRHLKVVRGEDEKKRWVN